jgi:hypothetical protein
MTTHALLHIAQELERMATDPDGAWPDELQRLAKFARGEAGEVPSGEHPSPEVLDRLDIGRISRGDVLARAWPEDGTLPADDQLYMVVRAHRKGRRVSVVDMSGVQLLLPLCEFTHRWPRDVAKNLHFAWRFVPCR